MTREEAIFIIEHRDSIMDYCESKQLGEALEMAIEALKAEPCEDCRKAEEIMQTLCDYGCEMKIQDAISQVLETECTKCEDAVSREHLLSEIDDLMQSPWFNNGKDDDMFTHYGYVERKEAVEVVRDLCVKAEPPVIPKPKTGKWTDDKCSVCGKGIEDLISSPEWYRNEEPKFCPMCGVKMEGESE